jgi:hypothetical protein
VSQPDLSAPDTSRDVTLSGPRADPDYGRGATFVDKGDKAGARSREQLEAIFQSVLDEAYRYRLPFETEWVTAYQQYHGETEDAGKEPWQSQAHVPKSAQAINSGVNRMLSVMFGNEDWFSVVADIKQQDVAAQRAQRLVRWQLDKAKAKNPIGQAIKHAFICGNGPLKIHFDTTIRETVDTEWKRNKPGSFMGQEIDMGGQWEFVSVSKKIRSLRFEPVLPFDRWLDPTGMNRFYIQRIKTTLSDVWAKARPVYADDGKTILRKAIYDPEVVALITPGAHDQRLDNQNAIARRERIQNIGQKSIDLYEFWGDLIDPSNGVTLYRNIFATFVDKRWCIRKPQRNPLLFGSWPFIDFRALLLPNQIYGYGMLAQSMKLQFEMDRVLQAVIDKVHLSVSMLEMDPSSLRKPEEIGGGNVKVEPGRIWMKKSGDRKIFNRVEGFEPPNEWEIQLLQILRSIFEESTQVNEFNSMAQQSTNRKTAKEVEVKQQAATASYNEAATFIEGDALGPLIQMVYKQMVQFEDEYDDPELLERFADEPENQAFLLRLKGMTLEERWRAMRLDTEFKVNGVTRDVTRQSMLGRVQNFMAMVQADPTMSGLIDKPFWLRLVLQLLDLPKELVLAQADAILQAMQSNMMMQMQNPPQQGAGGEQGQGAVGPAPPPGAAPFDNSHNRTSALAGRAHAATQGPPQ